MCRGSQRFAGPARAHVGPSPPTRLPPADLPDAQVVKRRPGGGVGDVTTQSSGGSDAAVRARVAASPVSQTRTPRGVARPNLPGRQGHGRLARKVLRFSTALPW